MVYPVGVTLRNISFGPSIVLEDGTALHQVAVIKASRSLVWNPTKTPVRSRTITLKSEIGAQKIHSLPVTDISGSWSDGNGSVIVLDPGEHTHTYSLKFRWEDDAGTVVENEETPTFNFVLPTDDLSTLDLDGMLPLPGSGGTLVSIPDYFATLLAEAEALLGAGVDASVAALVPGPSATATALSAKIETRNRAALRRARRALAAGSFKGIVWGDSWTEGTRGADLPWRRFVDHLLVGLRRYAQPADIRGGMYVPSFTTYPTRAEANWTFGGTTTQREISGYGLFNVDLAVGATATLTVKRGTGLRIGYDRRTDGATASVVVDGVSQTAIDSNGAAHYGQAADYPSIVKPGTHTIVITNTGSVGQIFSLHGAYIYDGDEASGIKLFPAGRGGSEATMLTSNGFTGNLQQNSPDLSVFAFGINEYRNNVAVATFKTRLTTAITTIKGRSADADSSLVILSCPQPAHPGAPLAPWADYKTAMAEVAVEQGAVLIDLTPIFGTGQMAVASGLVDADTVHPNDAGHMAIAKALLGVLTEPGAPAAVPQDEIFIPANLALSATGSPSLTVVNNTQLGWYLDQALGEGVLTVTKWPVGWREAALDLWYYNVAASAGNIRARAILSELAEDKSPLALADIQLNVVAGGQYVPFRSKAHVASVKCAPGTFLRIFTSRIANSGGDGTLANDVAFMGATLRRVA